MTGPVPATMKAPRLTKFNEPYEQQDIRVPSIGPTDLLVKVAAGGFCHTNNQVYEGVYQSPLPLAPSHEPIGYGSCGYYGVV